MVVIQLLYHNACPSQWVLKHSFSARRNQYYVFKGHSSASVMRDLGAIAVQDYNYKMPNTEILHNRDLFSHSTRPGKFKINMSANLVLGLRFFSLTVDGHLSSVSSHCGGGRGGRGREKGEREERGKEGSRGREGEMGAEREGQREMTSLSLVEHQ